MRSITAAAVFVLAAHGGYAQTPREGPPRAPERTEFTVGEVDVPLVMIGSLPAVDVTVNGQGPFRFLLDTGGQGLARADSGLVKRLSLPIVGKVKGGAPTTGQAVDMDLVRLDAIGIGGAIFHGVEAASRDYNAGRPADARVDGVLGFSLFADCDVTIDYPARRLRISRVPLPAANGQDVLEYRDPTGVPEIDVRVGDRTVPAILDTGSMGGIMLAGADIQGLKLAAAPAVIGRMRTITGESEIKEAPLAGAVQIGRYTFERPTLRFGDALRTANLGSAFLGAFALTFDQAHHRVRLLREGTAVTTQAAPPPAGAPPRGGLGIRVMNINGVLKVGGVLPDSPAARAGFEADDVILEIGGRVAADLSQEETFQELQQRPLKVKVRRGEKTITLTVEK